MATQDGSIDVPDSSENADALSVSKTEAASEGDIDVEKANVDTLHRNAIGIVGLVAGAAPGIPGPIGAAFTGLGFAPTPFPLNILSIFPLLWLIIGLVYTQVLSRTDPARFEKLGHIVRGEDQEVPV
jgi:hypothetical protein